MSLTDSFYLATEFISWCLMLSAEASLLVMLVLCAHEKPTSVAVNGEGTLAVIPNTTPKKTSSEASETSVTAEGTQEKNQTSPRGTPNKPIPTSQKPINNEKQAKSRKADKAETTNNNVCGKDPSKVKVNVSKSKPTATAIVNRNLMKSNKKKPLSSGVERTVATTTQSTIKSTEKKQTISVETKEEDEPTKPTRSVGDADLLSDQDGQRAKDLAKTLQGIPSVESGMTDGES